MSPYILVVGDLREPMQAFLVADCQVITEVELMDIPLVLMSVFCF